MSYELRLTRNAEKDLLALQRLTEQATIELKALKQDPLKGHPLHGSLRGARALVFPLEGVAYRAAYVILEQTADPPDLVARLKKLAGVLAKMTPEQFRQVTIWLKSASERKLPEPLRTEVDRVLDETKPQEVTKMISNVERALDKMQKEALQMQKQALMNGKAEGRAEGMADTARAALREGLDADLICKITGLSKTTVLELKKELEN